MDIIYPHEYSIFMGSEIEMKKYCHRRGEKLFKENTSLSQTKQKQEKKQKNKSFRLFRAKALAGRRRN